MNAHIKFRSGSQAICDLKSLLIQTAPAESECLEIQLDDEENEVRVIRHGMELEEGGECVYSQMLEVE